MHLLLSFKREWEWDEKWAQLWKYSTGKRHFHLKSLSMLEENIENLIWLVEGVVIFEEDQIIEIKHFRLFDYNQCFWHRTEFDYIDWGKEYQKKVSTNTDRKWFAPINIAYFFLHLWVIQSIFAPLRWLNDLLSQDRLGIERHVGRWIESSVTFEKAQRRSKYKWVLSGSSKF